MPAPVLSAGAGTFQTLISRLSDSLSIHFIQLTDFQGETLCPCEPSVLLRTVSVKQSHDFMNIREIAASLHSQRRAVASFKGLKIIEKEWMKKWETVNTKV